MLFSNEDSTYIALIGDIVRSKLIKDRDHVQRKLKNILENINQAYRNDIASDFTITLGDEFQALLLEGASIMPILLKIKREMYPTEIRFGIGIGAMRTAIYRNSALGSDGPSYYMARAAIEHIKKTEHRHASVTSSIRIEADEKASDAVALINTIFSLLAVLESQWSQRQRTVIYDLLEHDDSQANVAARLEIEQPTVNRHLARGNYYAYINAVTEIDNVLSSIRRAK